jgi:DNA-binding transcriptional regulator LsrR (DeoR family)
MSDVEVARERPRGRRPDAPSIELLTRVASMYYLEDMTQESIASQLGLSRPKVWRLLTQARETGIVTISVNLDPALAVPIETEMTARFGLARTILVVDQGDEDSVRANAGREAISLIERTMREGSIVTVGMGRSARAVSFAAAGAPARRCTVISAIGGSAQISEGLNSNDVATRLAQALGGSAEGIFAPAYAESQEIRDAFLRHDDIRRTVEHAREADIAIVGIGDADDESLVVRLGCITRAEMARMRRDGAVGDILGSFFNSEGQPIASWIEDRVVGLTGEDLRAIGNVVAVAPETSKAESILGALNSGIVDTLITSLSAARRILELAGPLSR